jgi:formate C-acetyltransferase
MTQSMIQPRGGDRAASAAPGGARDATGRAGLKRLVNLLDYYFARGGMQLQFNVVSRATLEAAQRDPERYRSLIVRVAGYSAYFVGLDKTVQQDIIERTEERLQ